jgi:hypothetical protein
MHTLMISGKSYAGKSYLLAPLGGVSCGWVGVE